MDNVSVPYVTVNAGSIALYSRPSNAGRSDRQRMNEVNLSANEHQGMISRKARARITKAIDWMLYLSKDKLLFPHSRMSSTMFRVNFITLTLSSKQVHSDNEIKAKLLNQMLIEMTKKWNVKNYIWRAEPQKNGNIHFHVLTDKFIPWSELRNTWNRIQDKLGYVVRSKHYKLGWTPNSTDVHSVKKVKNLSAYLAKYCTKESKVRKIQGKQWGLSTGMSKMKGITGERWSKIEDDLHKIFTMFKKQVKTYEHATVIYVRIEDWKKIGCSYLASFIDENYSNTAFA